MANAIKRRTIINGSRDYVCLFNITLDGSTAETATILNTTTGDMGVANRVVKIVANMPVPCTLLFDASSDVVFQGLQANTHTVIDFEPMGGGIINNAGSGVTGDVLITTIGNGTAGTTGTILMYVKKM